MKTATIQRLPPLYTHVIGSLPRPQVVLELLAQRDTMNPTEYQRRMDDMVRFAIQLQELAGLDVVSDGEWRRSQYTDEFLERVGGFPAAWEF